MESTLSDGDVQTALNDDYEVVPKGLLTFLGSLYREVAKITFGTLVYIASRDKPTEKKFFLPKTVSARLRM